MDNPQNNELSQWTRDCAALLAPATDWEPDPGAARARFEGRLQRRSGTKPYWLAGVAATLLSCLAILAIGPAPGFGQQTDHNRWLRLEQAWCWITLVHVSPALMRVGTIPEEAKSLRPHALARPAVPEVVSNLTEAARRVGFTPRLPPSHVVSALPVLSVSGPMSFGTVVDRAELQLALSKRGATDQSVPQSWDGVRITLNVAPAVTAAWSGVPNESSGAREWSELALTQGPMPVIVTPPGFDVAAFLAINLRITGRSSRAHATELIQHPTTAAAILFDNAARRNPLSVREVNLRGGPATLIEDLGRDSTVERITLLWSVPGRGYVLRGVLSEPAGNISPDLAAALVSMIHVANAME